MIFKSFVGCNHGSTYINNKSQSYMHMYIYMHKFVHKPGTQANIVWENITSSKINYKMYIENMILPLELVCYARNCKKKLRS